MSYTVNSITQMVVDENKPSNNQSVSNNDAYFKQCSEEVLYKIKAPEADEDIPVETFKENVKDINIDNGSDGNSGGIASKRNCYSRTSHISDFNDAECGEPIISQHLRIDFTPIPGIDDEEHLQEKCLDFWEFINNQPQIHKFKVYPIKKSDTTLTCDPEEKSEVTDDLGTEAKKEVKSTPALNWLTNKSVMKNVLCTKMDSKYCEDGDEDYASGSKVQRERSGGERTQGSSLSKIACEVISDCRCDKNLSMKRVPSPNALKRLCDQMEEWDATHLKSMDPPAHAPTLIHAVLQRNKPNLWK